MKPRLNAPLTQEDFDIWDRISEPYGIKPGIPLWGYIESDRRDADLMLEARTRLGPGPMCIESADCNGEFIDCCGAVLGSYLWHAPVST